MKEIKINKNSILVMNFSSNIDLDSKLVKDILKRASDVCNIPIIVSNDDIELILLQREEE